MTITILTLFKEVFTPIFQTSILKKATEKGLLDIKLVNIRDFANNRRKTVDDRPYGGGVGMIMRVDILYKAIQNAKCQMPNAKCQERIILLDPKGTLYTQDKARSLSGFNHLILICGHYEGVDSRIEDYVDEIISIGNFILTGGEIPAMVITDSVARLVTDVLPKDATVNESFENGFLEYPQYTRPREFRGQKIPEILFSGNHTRIETWRTSMRKKVVTS